MDEIYLRHGDRYVAMHETPYDAEDVLQELIQRHPQMLAGSESGQSLVLVRREAGIRDAQDASARWSLDHLYLDQDGIPTLVEVKRSSDTRSRREVVAQMLDYAAHARTSFSAERMADWLDEAARRRDSTGAETLLEVFGVEDVDAFWQGVDINLRAERLRLVFVSDSIGAELRSIIEFLARQMSPTELLAIEVKQYTDADGEHQTIVPRRVGDTAQAKARKRRGDVLDHDQVVVILREHDADAAQAADAILAWAEQAPRLDVRYTTTFGVIEFEGDALLKIRTNPDSVRRALELHVETLVKRGEPWNDQRIEHLAQELASVGVEFTDGRRWRYAPIEPLADRARRQQFLRRVDQIVQTLAETGGVSS